MLHLCQRGRHIVRCDLRARFMGLRPDAIGHAMKHHSTAKSPSIRTLGVLTLGCVAGAVAAWVSVTARDDDGSVSTHSSLVSHTQHHDVRVSWAGRPQPAQAPVPQHAGAALAPSSLAMLPRVFASQEPVAAAGAIWGGDAVIPTPDRLAESFPTRGDGSVLAPADLVAPQPPKLIIHPIDAPSDIDSSGAGLSVFEAPKRVLASDATVASLSRASRQGRDAPDVFQSMAGQTTVVYTPAQIKQAYGFAALPAATTANKFAYQGSGQTVVVIGAFDAPTVAADLNAFSVKFGLPTCTVLPNAYKAGVQINALVAKPKPGEGCSIQVLYVNSAGGATASPPPGNVNWATEAALDVQWVHAIAPMAKIVLVEALSNSGNDLMNAMAFASKLGASVVSMSFGAPEFSTQAGYDGLMSPTMTWVASSGDWGVGVNWPASSARVLGVGGTYLSNLSPRAETGWSGSGGGLSKFVAMPAYQAQVAVPGNPSPTPANASQMKRGVPDVAYNASSNSGVYVNYRGGWYGMGGTSAGAPQWAGLLAIANAVRANTGKAPLTAANMQNALYGQAKSSTYMANFLDIVSGANGTCPTCNAVRNYDLVTGLGSPHASSVVGVLVAAQ